MSLIPTFVPIRPVWRGNTSSAEINENFSMILYDLNTIFAEATNQSVSLEELKSTLKHETDALNERLYAVSGMIQAYEQSASGYKMFHEEFYRTRNIVYPFHLPAADRCYVDTSFGIVTLPISNSFSKVYSIDMNTGEIRQSPDLAVSINPTDEVSALHAEEGYPRRAFNGNNQSFWERKVLFSRDFAKDQVTCDMDILLPSMSNPNVNCFYMFPYPEGTVDIDQILYHTPSSKDNVLPGFPAEGEENATRKKYLFNEIQPVGFTIKFRQDNHKIEDDYMTFVYGAQEIGIESVEYRSTGRVGIKFELPAWETGVFSKITSLTTHPMYDNNKIKVYLYPNVGDFDADNPLWASTQNPIIPDNQLDVSAYATETIYLTVEINQELDSTTTPVLESITFTYTTE
jgi:hypothetical protein